MKKKKYLKYSKYAGIVLLGIIIYFVYEFISAGKNQTVYKYEDASVADNLKFRKTVYRDGRIDLYMRGDMDDSFKVKECYNSKLELLDGTWETKYSSGKYSIIGEKASEISGIVIENDKLRYRIRYLDSKQYAILWEQNVTDKGWKSFGDEKAYDTKEEWKAKKEAERADSEKKEKNFRQFEGK